MIALENKDIDVTIVVELENGTKEEITGLYFPLNGVFYYNDSFLEKNKDIIKNQYAIFPDGSEVDILNASVEIDGVELFSYVYIASKERKLKEYLKNYVPELISELEYGFYGNKFVIKDVELNLQFAYLFDELFKENENHILISDSFQGYKHNPQESKMNFYSQKGFNYKGYSEFFYVNDFFLEYIEQQKYDRKEFNGLSFFIGETEVTIKKPSHFFKFLNHVTQPDGRFRSWDNVFTISFKGVTDGEVEEFLQEVFYYLSKVFSVYNNESHLFRISNEEPTIFFERLLCKIEGQKFPRAKHVDCLAYYNKGLSVSRVDSFKYFYNVLEYFFIVVTNEKIKNLETKYPDFLIDFKCEIGSALKDSERMMIKYLLEDMCEKNGEAYIRHEMFKALSSDLIENFDLDVFADKLYDYRNGDTHSKTGTKEKVKPPRLLTKYEDDAWVEISKSLAEKLINQRCF